MRVFIRLLSKLQCENDHHNALGFDITILDRKVSPCLHFAHPASSQFLFSLHPGPALVNCPQGLMTS